MAEQPYQVTDRRPIAARRLMIFHSIANHLVKAGVSANTISVAGGICGIAAGGALATTPHVATPWNRVLWLSAAALVQLRLLANLLDGMVAITAGKASAYGELFNEVPDRISDPCTLIGLGYAAGGSPALGWLAAVAALLTAYIRVLGKSAGVGSDFSGPMAKQQRMFIVTMASLYCAVAPRAWTDCRPVRIALVIIAIGALFTATRRLRNIAAKLRGSA